MAKDKILEWGFGALLDAENDPMMNNDLKTSGRHFRHNRPDNRPSNLIVNLAFIP
jgi:hypothetical protein